MRKFIKVILITASIMFTIGLILVITGLLSGGRFKNISIIGGHIKDTVSINEDYSNKTIENLDLELAAGNLHIKEGDTFRVTGKNIIKDSLEVGVDNNTLYIKEKEDYGWGWLVHIGQFFYSNEADITVTIPKNFTAKTTELEVHAGELDLEKLTTDHLDVKVRAGDVVLDKLTVTTKASIDVSAGKVIGEDFNGKNLEIDVSAGSCSLEGAFYDTLDMECSAGHIKIDSSLEENQYSYDLDQSAGSIHVNGESYKHYDGKNEDAANHIMAKTSAGSIKIETK